MYILKSLTFLKVQERFDSLMFSERDFCIGWIFFVEEIPQHESKSFYFLRRTLRKDPQG